MTGRWPWIGTAAAGALLSLTLTVSAQTKDTKTAPRDAAATIGSEVISLTELEARVAVELVGLDTQRYRVLEEKLTQAIRERLLAREAQRRGVSVEALLQAEVLSKVPPVTAGDVNAFIVQNRLRPAPADAAALRAKVADHLHRLQVDRQTEAFVGDLRTRTPVQVYLKPPDSRRVTVDASGFAQGPREAPVTIVEFSDFQCPFCKDVVPTLKQLMVQYPDRVRWVFRDFPIPSLHPDAPLVHEAARCAGEQGKFWPYHDLLFDRATDMSAAALKRYAAELGADSAAFDQCLDGHKHQATVNADIEAGSNIGVTATPTFLINGEVLVGSQPLEDFQRIIERELARAAAKK